MNEKITVYDAFSVRKFTSPDGEKSEFLKIGVAFPLKAKKGFTLKLSSLPVSGEIVVMERVPKSEPKGDAGEPPF